jgi:hypothetical protein
MSLQEMERRFGVFAPAAVGEDEFIQLKMKNKVQYPHEAVAAMVGSA